MITLFMERAQAVTADFELTEANAGTVAAICIRLDGLLLAIELISARVKRLPPPALLERLSGRLLLQSDCLRDIEPRHRTLTNAIDWSYELLNEEEQRLFRRLGEFGGGWTLEAAEAVCLENRTLNIIDGHCVVAGQKPDQTGSEIRRYAALILVTIVSVSVFALTTIREEQPSFDPFASYCDILSLQSQDALLQCGFNCSFERSSTFDKSICSWPIETGSFSRIHVSISPLSRGKLT